MNDELKQATKALIKLYAEWERFGGPSPDARDEARVIAQACGFNENDVTSEELDVIYQMACEGASPSSIAAAYLAALKGDK